MSDLSSLIARLEKAEGPSRDLDVEIMNTVDPRSPDEKRLFDGKVYPATWGAVGQLCDQIRYFIEAPFLTSSIDAAVSLAERVVPGASFIMGFRQTDKTMPWARIGNRSSWDNTAPTLAMSICLATLRALDQKGSSNG